MLTQTMKSWKVERFAHQMIKIMKIRWLKVIERFKDWIRQLRGSLLVHRAEAIQRLEVIKLNKDEDI